MVISHHCVSLEESQVGPLLLPVNRVSCKESFHRPRYGIYQPKKTADQTRSMEVASL